MGEKEPGIYEGDTFCRQQIGVDPDVKGYRMLLRAPVINTKTKSGLIMPDGHRETKQRYENIGLVLALGPICFKGEMFKYDTEPRFKIGDWIFYSTYEREKITKNSFGCYYITDDRGYSVIPPRDYPIILENMH